jgi:hypothetical protein
MFEAGAAIAGVSGKTAGSLSVAAGFVAGRRDVIGNPTMWAYDPHQISVRVWSAVELFKAANKSALKADPPVSHCCFT